MPILDVELPAGRRAQLRRATRESWTRATAPVSADRRRGSSQKGRLAFPERRLCWSQRVACASELLVHRGQRRCAAAQHSGADHQGLDPVSWTLCVGRCDSTCDSTNLVGAMTQTARGTARTNVTRDEAMVARYRRTTRRAARPTSSRRRADGPRRAREVAYRTHSDVRADRRRARRPSAAVNLNETSSSRG